jgi:homoserine kinase
MIVSAPASSANLGPGFDCLGLALDLPFEVRSDEPPEGEGWLVAEPTHPAAVAFRAAGGDGDTSLWWRSPIPPGRGLGFSGASRVAGAYLAGRLDGLDHDAARDGALQIAAELEGHADNAAASALGGFTVATGSASVSMQVPAGLAAVLWWPERSTSTDASRRALPEAVPLADVTFSIARAALWVAAIGTGDTSLLRTACQDRVHQPGRLAARPDSAQVLEHLLGDDRVVAAWLSGSGPTVAALVPASDDVGLSEDLVAMSGGRSRRLRVAEHGVATVGRNT